MQSFLYHDYMLRESQDLQWICVRKKGQSPSNANKNSIIECACSTRNTSSVKCPHNVSMSALKILIGNIVSQCRKRIQVLQIAQTAVELKFQ